MASSKQTSEKKSAKPASTPKLNVKDFAKRISKGESLTDPDHLQFYENNKAAIEQELQSIQLASGPAKESTPASSTPPSTETTFNPLEQQVNEKPYSGVGANGEQQVSDIPEPTYQTAPEETFIPQKEVTKKEQTQIEKAKQAKTGNPEMAGLSDTEKYEGAAALATVVLTTWEQAYAGLNQVFSISEKKVNKMQQAGQIDVRVEVPYKMTVQPLSAVLRDYNNDAQNLLVLEPEFKEAVHPLMAEEFAKSGHGMSNRGQLIFMIATKLANDGLKAAQFLSLKKDYLKFAREATASSRKMAPRVQQVAATEPVATQPEVNNEETGRDEQVYTPPQTIQQEALERLGPPGGVNNTANFGNTANLSKLNKEYEKDKKTERKSSPKKSAIAAVHIAHAKTSSDPIPTPGQRKGRGRPPGAKNKKGKKK